MRQYQSPNRYTPIIYRYCRWQYMNFDCRSFILTFFLCIYFFQLMFYTLSIAVTAVFDFALTSLMRIMILLHPASRQSINLAPSSSWFQQIPFWFQGCISWGSLGKHLRYQLPMLHLKWKVNVSIWYDILWIFLQTHLSIQEWSIFAP